ncbi:family 78 glycoside hydrolase catalytic domain [Alicyclobacillus fodiniaquatilis]|uniref:alpha-L-rhamnosidase n=1 Tax=Alicyclobacillus fodiniaquatilis TaxID=1661150 RepID=A0ABW4JPW3_9BACL
MDRSWQAKWIMDPQFSDVKPLDLFHKETEKSAQPQHRADLQNRHMLLRKTFVLSDTFTSAFLDISADDYYKLYVNDQFVGQGPAQGNYFHYFYNRYDISKYLQPGQNVIAVHVYYQGFVCRAFNSADHRQGMIAELFVDNDLVLKTDGTWKYRITEEYGQGELIGYRTQVLEHVDNRLKEPAWRRVEFDDSSWQPVWVHHADDHKLVWQPTPTLSVYEMKPERVEQLHGAQHYVIDFGQEITGQFHMFASGNSGDKIEIRCGEELNPDGVTVRYEMRCNCTYQEFWTLSGREEDELEFFDYKAFRYVEVIGKPDVKIDVERFSAIVRHFPFDEETCTFTSSHALLNQIWTICKNGVKYGTQENYVDCPSREKGQYLGDNTVITHAHGYLTGDLRMFKKALYDFALLSSRVCPGFVAVAPGHFMQEIADFSLQWPIQLLEYYRQSGDIEFLREMYPLAQALLQHFKQYERADGLLCQVTDKWNVVDWPEGMRDDYDVELSIPIGDTCHIVINAFYFGSRLAVQEIARHLHLPVEDLSDFRRAFQRTFFNPATQLFVDAEGSQHTSLHAVALPLLFDLFPRQAKSNAVDFIAKKGLQCGVYMAYFVLKALASAGAYQVVYDLITSDDTNAWSTMVKEGATTCFEAWSKELKWNTSLCHPWASAPIPILIEEIIGLRPAAPGWQAVQFTPHIPAELRDISIQFRVKTGVIRCTFTDGQPALELPDGVQLVQTT